MVAGLAHPRRPGGISPNEFTLRRSFDMLTSWSESLSTILAELPPPVVPFAVAALLGAGLLYAGVQLGVEIARIAKT
jgi:hypothetical protein